MALSKHNIETLPEWEHLVQHIQKTIDDLQDEVVEQLTAGETYKASATSGQITAYKWLIKDALEFLFSEGK